MTERDIVSLPFFFLLLFWIPSPRVRLFPSQKPPLLASHPLSPFSSPPPPICIPSPNEPQRNSNFKQKFPDGGNLSAFFSSPLHPPLSPHFPYLAPLFLPRITPSFSFLPFFLPFFLPSFLFFFLFRAVDIADSLASRRGAAVSSTTLFCLQPHPLIAGIFSPLPRSVRYAGQAIKLRSSFKSASGETKASRGCSFERLGGA